MIICLPPPDVVLGPTKVRKIIRMKIKADIEKIESVARVLIHSVRAPPNKSVTFSYIETKRYS